MNAANLIAHKRDGGELTSEEIGFLVRGYARGELPDYQMSAWAMAVYLRGMTTDETAFLTDHMLHSGVRLQWPDHVRPVVDKHSTGGIGDKVSLILTPLLACCGLHVPMISGRGLGPTGGTLDKLESIPGFRANLSVAEMQDVTARVGCVISGATDNLVPADRKLYALRDVTATVPSIPLITASIMSKKLAEGLDALVVDVKWGSGAFMKSREGARDLAHSLVATGSRMGVAMTALITDMNQPLGRMIGNAVEVDESIAALSGVGPNDLMEVTVALGAELCLESGLEADACAASARLKHHVETGAGLQKFREMVTAQGGDLDAPRSLAPRQPVESPVAGYVHKINAEQLGHAVIQLKGGRQKLGERLDHSTGIEMLVRLGDQADHGQPLANVLASPGAASAVRDKVRSAFTLSDSPPAPSLLIVDRIQASE